VARLPELEHDLKCGAVDRVLAGARRPVSLEVSHPAADTWRVGLNDREYMRHSGLIANVEEA
jgi:hypothetical protein